MIGDEELYSERTTPESFELHRLFRRMANEGCTHVVMEVSSHSLALERVAGITFDVAVFTNLSQDHLDLHGTGRMPGEPGVVLLYPQGRDFTNHVITELNRNQTAAPANKGNKNK